MIKIEIFRNDGGEIFGLHVSGHSGTAQKGQDVVCAGVSVLAQTALVGISEHLQRDVDYAIDPGGDLRFTLRDKPDVFTAAIFETVRLGFAGICEAHPNAVRLREVAENRQKLD